MYDEIVNAWNSQSDEFNSWGNLGEDEKIEFAALYSVKKYKEITQEGQKNDDHNQ